MNKLADERGFAVVYMEALKQPMPWPFGSSEAFTWNLDHGTLTPKDPSYDDLTYIKDVDKALSSQLNVDGRGKYLAGFSEGALAAQYVAQQMKGTFAGVALVHGTLLEDDPRPAVGDPTATIVVLGNDDNMFALNGGHGWFQGGSLIKGFMSLNFGKVSKSRPLQQTQAWAQANRCSDPKTVDTKHNTITTYSCQDAPVKQIIRKSHIHNWWYQGGMHAWDGPGQDVHAKYGWPVVGEPDRTEDTSRQIVDFLFQYEKSE
jgi:poly(3-hydroxybutyrate) depolymerase